MDVQTREGIFGGGAYGGGVFDGSNMGFGGLGALTSPSQWTIGPNEWPSTVSQSVVKSTTRWKELVAANPGMKLVTINGQPNLSPWKVGQVVNLPASWVPSGAVATSTRLDTPTNITGSSGQAAAPAPCFMAFGDKSNIITEFQDQLNDALISAGYNPIALTGTYDAATCGAIFQLGGSFHVDLSDASPECSQWVFPLDCPNKVLPTKPAPGEPPADKPKTGSSNAWMIGGLIGAAVLTGLYIATKKKAA